MTPPQSVGRCDACAASVVLTVSGRRVCTDDLVVNVPTPAFLAGSHAVARSCILERGTKLGACGPAGKALPAARHAARRRRARGARPVAGGAGAVIRFGELAYPDHFERRRAIAVYLVERFRRLRSEEGTRAAARAAPEVRGSRSSSPF
jgi:hypothetical protein